jgi:F420-dependent oxidoreductase-like protein
MRICLMIEGQEGVTWEDWAGIAKTAEESGLDGLFRSDHYLSGDGRVGLGSLDAWTTLAAIAARTSRIRLGTMVSPVTFRSPSLVANAAVTVDHVSGGRVELGLGAGWYEMEHEAFGFPFPPLGARMSMLEEQLEIITRQWTEDEFSFEGRHYRLDRCPALPKPLQRPRPPIVVGGSGMPRTVAAAVRYADEYNMLDATPQGCRALRRTLDEACERAGRDPSTLVLSLMTTCVVGSGEPDLHRRVQAVARLWGYDGSPADVLDAHRDEWIAGTIEQAAARLNELQEAGLGRAMLRSVDHADLEMIELLGRELAPLLV